MQRATEVLRPAMSISQVARSRRRVGFGLTAGLFVLWFGFVLLVAFAKESVSAVMMPGVTWALAGGFGVMVGSWLLCGVYMFWAERSYDAAVLRIRSESVN